jgi:hypothetical protein
VARENGDLSPRGSITKSGERSARAAKSQGSYMYVHTGPPIMTTNGSIRLAVTSPSSALHTIVQGPWIFNLTRTPRNIRFPSRLRLDLRHSILFHFHHGVGNHSTSSTSRRMGPCQSQAFVVDPFPSALLIDPPKLIIIVETHANRWLLP